MTMVSDDMLPLVEACCDSVHTVREAQAFGAGRIELCGPGDGGTTPSMGLMARCRDEVQIPLHVMIRPRAGDFVYSEDEIDVMCHDIQSAKALGVSGLVLGCLQADHTIHQQYLAELLALARPLPVVFHRAFDRTPDPMQALEVLLKHDVSGVLTAGHASSAVEGAERLRALQERAGQRLTVIAGGGVRAQNVRTLVDRAGVREVHARATDPNILRDVVLALSSSVSESSRLR